MKMEVLTYYAFLLFFVPCCFCFNFHVPCALTTTLLLCIHQYPTNEHLKSAITALRSHHNVSSHCLDWEWKAGQIVAMASCACVRGTCISYCKAMSLPIFHSPLYLSFTAGSRGEQSKQRRVHSPLYTVCMPSRYCLQWQWWNMT